MKPIACIIGLLSLFVACESGLLGAKECTFGPSYWCGSIRNAKQCNAVKHCIQTVWEKQILPEDNDDVCGICKDMVKEARDQLLSNETQDEIKQVFEGSCKLIPVTIIRDECIKVSDEFIPELIDTLASQMNPQVVCATAGLCNNPFVDRILKENQKQQVDTSASVSSGDANTCSDCKTFLTDLINNIKRHSKAEVLDHLLAICGRISSLSDGCMALVRANFEDIYNFLTTGLEPESVCELFAMCDRMYGSTGVTLPNTGELPCDFCVAIVRNWRNNLVANTTREEFKMILDGVCHQTGQFEKECLALVDQYFDVLYDLLISEIEPKEICRDIGLCGPNSLFKDQVPVWTFLGMRSNEYDRLPLLRLRPSFDSNDLIGMDEANSYNHNIPLPDSNDLIGLDEANSYNHDIHLPNIPLSRESVSVVIAGQTGVLNAGDDRCVMCEFVLHFLQNILQDQKTRDEVKHAVESVCKLLPHSLSESCEDYIDAYGDQLIQLIILEIDPATICPMLNLCPGKTLQSTPVRGPSCVICEYAMTELDEILKDKSDEEAIKKALDSICSIMPSTVRSECKTFVDTYVDQIIDLLVNDFTPREVCAAIGLCFGSKAPVMPLPAPESAQLTFKRYFLPALNTQDFPKKQSTEVGKQSVSCVICEFVVSKLDELLLEDSTEQEIKDAVKKVCLVLPTTLMNDCLGFMEEYGNSMIELLVNRIEPEFVCKEVRLCRPSSLEGLPTAAVAFPVNKCLVCEKVVDWVEKYEKPEKAVDYAEKIMNSVCKIIPGKAGKTCKEMALKYGNYLEKLLEELQDSKRVCQTLKMCPYHGTKPLLGAKRCTWGPAYWCQTEMHAEACQATEHCVAKVWMGEKPSY